LTHYYHGILELEADIAAGENEDYVAKSIDRIFTKIEMKFKENYTRETLEKKIKSFDTRSDVILEADKTLQTETNIEEQIQQVQLAAIAKAA
jgi:predicted RNA binding protein with dsRBD fold (UPF0201 family)